MGEIDRRAAKNGPSDGGLKRSSMNHYPGWHAQTAWRACVVKLSQAGRNTIHGRRYSHYHSALPRHAIAALRIAPFCANGARGVLRFLRSSFLRTRIQTCRAALPYLFTLYTAAWFVMCLLIGVLHASSIALQMGLAFLPLSPPCTLFCACVFPHCGPCARHPQTPCILFTACTAQ